MPEPEVVVVRQSGSFLGLPLRSEAEQERRHGRPQEDGSTLLSRLTFGWLEATLSRGYRKRLEPEDALLRMQLGLSRSRVASF